MSLSDTLSCPYLVCALSSSRVPGSFEVVLLLPFAIIIFPPAVAAAAGWDSFCMSSNSHPPPPHFHPSHLFISLLSLSPAASDSLPGKSYLPPGLCDEVSCSICVRRWLWVMGFLCPHTSCLPHIIMRYARVWLFTPVQRPRAQLHCAAKHYLLA